MTERERESNEPTDDDAMSVGWRRIWGGALLLGVAFVVQAIGVANDAPGVLLLTVPCGFFGVVLLLIGTAAEGVLLAERSKTVSDALGSGSYASEEKPT